MSKVYVFSCGKTISVDEETIKVYESLGEATFEPNQIFCEKRKISICHGDPEVFMMILFALQSKTKELRVYPDLVDQVKSKVSVLGFTEISVVSAKEFAFVKVEFSKNMQNYKSGYYVPNITFLCYECHKSPDRKVEESMKPFLTRNYSENPIKESKINQAKIPNTASLKKIKALSIYMMMLKDWVHEPSLDFDKNVFGFSRIRK